MNSHHCHMRLKCVALILCTLYINVAYSQCNLDRQIVSAPDSFTFVQILDTLAQKEHLDFSYDASLLKSIPTIYKLDSTFTVSKWLDSVFESDSTEWIFIENQIIVRLRKDNSSNQVTYHFKGKVLSDDGGEPIPFATIAILGSSFGTVANSNGEFDMVCVSDSLGCSLNISSLGFSAVNSSYSSSNLEIEVRLKQSFVELPEAVVVRVDPLMVMQNVVQKRFDNYLQSPTLLRGFFRESIYSNGYYVEVVEAAISMSKPSYFNQFASEKVMVEKVRRYKADSEDGDVNLKMQGGPFYFSKLDVARYGDFLPTSDNGLNGYSYSFEGYATNLDRTSYVVAFKPINDNIDLVYTGQFYIDKESFAITRVEFQLTDKSIKRSKSFFVQSENRNARTIPLLAKYEVNYRPSGTGWMLSYAKGELLLNITHKRRWRSQQYKAITELAITASEEGKYQILRNGYMKAKDILSEKACENSSFFWKGYVVIPSLEEVEILFESK